MSCNKCHKPEHQCECHEIGCDPTDSKCTIYNGENGCSGILETGGNLEDILKNIDDKLCENFNISLITCVKEYLGIPNTTDVLSPNQLFTYIQQWICNYKDEKVKVSSGDFSTGYLFDKIVVGDCLIKSIVRDELTGVQQLKISIDFGCVGSKVPQCFEIETNNCIIIDNSELPCNPIATVPIITRTNLTLNSSNCNGVTQWYNSNNQLIGTGTSITVEGGATYYSKCATACGNSEASNSLNVPVLQTYTATRKAIFTKECGVNECNVPCLGSTSEFSKVYTSLISQADANAKAENDTTFSIEGQNKINLEGTCTCFDCNCTFPVYNNNIVVTNATCNGNTVNANGQILIVGINNADKFGFSVGAGDYSGVSYQSAITLNNYNQNNVETTPTTIKLKALSIETRVVFRLFNGAANCFKDIVVTLTPPDCTQEQVEITDTTISCEITNPICNNYSIVAGGSGATYWYENCITGSYVPETLLANTSTQKCSRIAPQVTGGVATLNGIC